MRADIRHIASRASRALGVPVRLVLVDKPIRETAMSVGELEHYATLRGTQRATSWRLGRAALKRLLNELRRETDTARITFPNGTCSLSHTAGFAVAAGTRVALPGIGVDMELRSRLRAEAGRFFLRPHEQRCAATTAMPRSTSGRSGARAADAWSPERRLVRLWTIKEALFKADPENDGALLCDYEIERPQVHCGLARSPHGRRFKYASWPFGTGFLAVAIAEVEST